MGYSSTVGVSPATQANQLANPSDRRALRRTAATTVWKAGLAMIVRFPAGRAHRPNAPGRLLRRITAFILIPAAVGLSICPGRRGDCGEKSRVPNIIFILTDDKY